MSVKRLIMLVLCVVTVFSSIGCSSYSSSEKADIRGKISSLSSDSDGKVISFLVEGKIDDGTIYDKASVMVDNKTKIFDKATGKKLSSNELKDGVMVEVVFTGPVRESYPVQATAKTIRILEE